MDKVRERTGIYHEHQQGSLCAQHALNNLLQSQMFLADSLADIARELDAEEKSVLTHGSFQSENMDDTGFFSIQVLQRALKIFDIELVPTGSQESIAKDARNSPESVEAYICNLGLHWFTIRRFGRQFFNLNSLYYVPEIISNRMLLAHLNLIEQNGYSVFIVHGNLPECLANQQLAANPINERDYQLLIKDLPKFIMDGKILEDPKGEPKSGNLVVQLPSHLMKELEKNPDNPHIREMIYAQLPKGMLDGEMSEYTDYSDPHNHGRRRRRRQLLITAIPERSTDEQLIEPCDCSYHRQQSQMLSEHFPEQMIDDSRFDDLNEPYHEAQIRTQHLTQYIFAGPTSNNSNAPPQQRVLATRQIVYMTQLSHSSNTLIDNNSTQRMIQPSYSSSTVIDNNSIQRMIQPPYSSNTVIDNNSIQRMIQPSHRSDTVIDNNSIQRMIQPSIGLENEDDLLLQHVVAQSLLSTSGINEDIDVPSLESRTEMLYQRLLDKVMADSLTSNNSITRRLEETPITSIDSSSTPTMNSEPITIKIPPSSLTSHSPPSTKSSLPPPTSTHLPPSASTSASSATKTHSLPLTNTYSSPPILTNSIPLTNTYSPPPATSNLAASTTINSTPPTNNYSPPPPNNHSPLPATTNLASSTTVSAPPPTNNHSPLPATTNLAPSTTIKSPSVTNTYSPLSTITNSISPTTKNLPSSTAANASLSTVTNSDSKESPTVEELRQRRLQVYGNRDRSIISIQSNFND